MSSAHPDNDPVDRLAFEEHLLKGERLLWVGRPGQGLRLGHEPIRTVIVMLGVTALCVGIVWDNLFRTPDHVRIDTFTIAAPFVVFWTWIGQFVFDAWQRSRLRYAVTSRRVLFLAPGTFAAVWANDLYGLELQGGQTIWLRKFPIDPSERSFMPAFAFDFLPGYVHNRLMYLRDARRVFELISQADRSGS